MDRPKVYTKEVLVIERSFRYKLRICSVSLLVADPVDLDNQIEKEVGSN